MRHGHHYKHKGHQLEQKQMKELNDDGEQQLIKAAP